ncbi:GntP family permease [candidate division KSB1 bacterium]
MEILPVFYLLLSVILLLILIVRFGVHPFLTLLIIGLFLGLADGMSFEKTLESLLDGFAGTLRWIGIVMVFGTIIGEILTETGASKRISTSILQLVGKKRVPLTMGLTGYIVSISVFSDIAYIMLQSITESLTVKSKRTILVVGLSLTAGLAATHALIPPTPGPLAASGILGADLGKVILINTFVAIVSVIGGLLWVTLYCKKIELPYDRELRKRFESKEAILTKTEKTPKILGSYAPILLPLILIAVGSFVSKQDESLIFGLLKFLGSPVIALFIGMLLAANLLERKGRIKRIYKLLDRSIEKAAVVIMVTGAGGAFGSVIKASNISGSVSSIIESTGIPGVLFPFLLAMALTTSTGSITVSMVTSSAVVAPLIGALGISPEMAVALIGAGSLSIIHANSSFFWLLHKLHDVPPNILYRTLSVKTLCMGLSGFIAAIILWLFGVH